MGRAEAHDRVRWSAEIAGAASSRTGKPKSIHFPIPPSRGRTRVIPLRLSKSATRALVASLGQEQ
jgi:hypothetical protein